MTSTILITATHIMTSNIPNTKCVLRVQRETSQVDLVPGEPLEITLWDGAPISVSEILIPLDENV